MIFKSLRSYAHLKLMKKPIYLATIIICMLKAQTFSIARIHYGGGGDWYSDPSSIPNLLNFIRSNTSISTRSDEVRIKLTDKNIFQYLKHFHPPYYS